MISSNVRMAQDWAAFYRARGMNPLPSRTDDKRPLLNYAEFWEKQLPDDSFERFPTTNIQIMTGRFWRLIVIDLDGDEARRRFNAMGHAPRTWITHTGGDGQHWWFRLIPDCPKELPKAMIWKGDGQHQGIERLCDRSLVMAPPSIHPKTGERYRFLDPSHSPKRLPMPADCPLWVLRLQPLVPAVSRVTSPLPVHLPPKAVASISRVFDRDQVIAAIPNKLALAQSWGLRITGKPTAKGWTPCHAIGREDVHPSAAIHQESGHYVDHGTDVKMSLFDLGVALGVYRDWREAVQDLGQNWA